MKKSEALNILGLHDGASDDDIKQAHRAKVRANHPDRFTDPAQKQAAEDKTKLINEARDVLISRKWDPEYGPRTGGYGNPYTSPYTGYRPASSGHGTTGQGTGQQDPFAGWPFETVWTSWDNIGGQGSDPFPFDFDSFFTQVPTKSAQQEAEEAKRDLNLCTAVFAAKLALLLVFALMGNIATGMFLYILATVLFSAYFNASGCSRFLLVPMFTALLLLVMVFIPPAGSTLTAPTAVFFLIAFVYDISTLRHQLALYRTLKEKARVTT